MRYQNNKWLFILFVKMLMVFLVIDQATSWIIHIDQAFKGISCVGAFFLILISVLIVSALCIVMYGVHDFVDALLDGLCDLISDGWQKIKDKWKDDAD